VKLSGFSITKKSSKPFVLFKYTGGKNKLAKEIAPLIESTKFDRYFEPFCGSAAIFFNTKIEVPAFLSDECPMPIAIMREVREDPEKVYDEVEQLSERLWTTDGTAYYDVRKKTPNCSAAEWLFLATASFNGLTRFSSDGKWRFTASWSKRYSDCPECVPKFHMPLKNHLPFERLTTAAEKLKNTTIERKDYWTALFGAKRGDLVYLDPPYFFNGKDEPTAAYGLNWTETNEAMLIKRLDLLTEEGIKWIMSNSAMQHGKRNDYLIGALRKYNQREIDYTYTINPEANTGKSRELLVWNY
jgi:DNA adenine methylase